jgi:hypothetical protein
MKKLYNFTVSARPDTTEEELRSITEQVLTEESLMQGWAPDYTCECVRVFEGTEADTVIYEFEVKGEWNREES